MTQPPTQEQVERIVAGLTKAQRLIVIWFDRWKDMPLAAARTINAAPISETDDLLRNGILETRHWLRAINRRFITPLGLAVRAHLITKGSDQ